MVFLPKCRAFNVDLEKGHGAGKKGMALEKKGMARRHAKTGQGKHYDCTVFHVSRSTEKINSDQGG